MYPDYTQPEEVNRAYEVLSSVSNRFTVAAAFRMFMVFINPVMLSLLQRFYWNRKNS